MKKLGKKGIGFHEVPAVGLTFLIVGIVFAVALVVLAAMQSPGGTIDGNSAANAAVTKARTAVSEIPANWLLIIAVIIAASVIVGVLFSAFGNQMGAR